MSGSTTRWTLIFLLWLAGLGAAAQYAKVSVVYDLFEGIYGHAGAALGFAVSLLGVVGVVLGVVSGLFVARIRFRRALIWALWIGAAASLYQATLPPFWLFLLSRVVEGMSHLAVVVAAPTLMTALCASRHSGPVMSIWSTFFGVAFAVFVFAGRPLAEQAGVPALLMAHAGYLVLIAVLLSALLPDTASDASAEPLSLSDVVTQHANIYRSPWVGAPAVGWLFFTFASIGILTLLRPFVDPGWQDAVLGAIPLVSIASSLTIGVWIVRSRGAIWTVEVGFLLCAGLAAGLLILPGSPVICLLLAAAMGLVQAASFAAVPELVDDTETRALGHGAMAQSGNLGNLVAPPLLAFMIVMGGETAFIVGLVMSFALGALAHLVLHRSRIALTTDGRQLAPAEQRIIGRGHGARENR